MAAARTADKIEHPQAHYHTPDELLREDALSVEEKKRALNAWEQDARQMLTASGEGMSGSAEGVNRDDHHGLGQVTRAKQELRELQANKR
jgi:hypothetical protein